MHLYRVRYSHTRILTLHRLPKDDAAPPAQGTAVPKLLARTKDTPKFVRAPGLSAEENEGATRYDRYVLSHMRGISLRLNAVFYSRIRQFRGCDIIEAEQVNAPIFQCTAALKRELRQSKEPHTHETLSTDKSQVYFSIAWRVRICAYTSFMASRFLSARL